MSQTNRGEDRQKIVLRFQIQKPDFVAMGKSLFLLPKKAFLKLFYARLQWRILAAVAVLVLADIYGVFHPFFQDNAYALGNGAGLLSKSSPEMAALLKYDPSQQLFNFDPGQSAQPGELGTPNRSSAKIYKDAKKGITVTDPVNKIDFTMVPKFQLQDGRQEGDRVIYPLANGSGWAVYTLKGVGVKEDIILSFAPSDTASFAYTLKLGDSLKAKIEKDGSLGIYGNTLLSSNITAGTDKDEQLLQKARKNAPKDKLLFVIPPPVVLDKHGPADGIDAKYSLDGDELTVTATGLKKGHYPITIDPSIYVVTASQFMQGNNETNINFDVDNKLIKKGRTTGARFDQWNSTSGLPLAEWGGQTVPAGGYVYTVGGTSFSGQVYSSQGASTYVVPAGVTSITVKMWGGGGGGGGGDNAVGGAGGGGGYVTETLTVTPGETLNVYVGGGGGGGIHSGSSGAGGAGGGYSSLYRSTTPLAIAAGGGGGGGGRGTSTQTGGAGGAGGGTTGEAGGAAGGSSTANNGGGAGTPSAGGTAGSTGDGNPGTNGSSLTGGAGGDGRSGAGADGSGAAGGLATGGNGGSVAVATRAGGGGGGAGYFGGAGGNGSATLRGASAGGGGSSYTDAGATSVTNTAGSGTSPGNSGDSSRSGAGDGGVGGAVNSDGGAGDDGIVAITYGAGGVSNSSSINWAKFNTGTGTIDSANPGTGACSGWCTTAAYNLPDGRSNFSLVAYNGFLYAMGGTSANCTTGNSTGTSTYCKTVYIAKLGANGEPRLWHPTDTDPNNWTYWYRDTDLPSERAYAGAVAYNNRLYFMGGRTSSGATTAVHIADVTPSGKLGTWTSSGNTLPSSNQYAPSAQVYNDRLYVIGGASSTTAAPTNAVYYSKINSDGTINTWQQTSSFTTGRHGNGTNISVIWGSYVYISGGCSAVNASGYCTSIASDAQVASINADGSLDTWNTITGVSDARMSHSLFAWRDNIYEIGGCTAQNATSGDCNGGMLSSIKYGTINQDGDASTVSQSSASGAGTCTGASPTNCNLPGTTYIGNLLGAAVITNGYLYVIGGCTGNACSTIAYELAYVSISSTGVMSKPATCPSGFYVGATWCVDTTHLLTVGLAASSPVVFGGNLYLVGGLTGTGNSNLIFRTTVNSDGSIGSWTSQSMTGVSATSVAYAYAFARANPSSAGTNPGNLYIFGGCTTTSGAACSAYTGNVYKCNIQTSGAIASCSTSSQLQIGTLPGGSSAGLAIMSGTTYANYVYLIGGVSPDFNGLDSTRYAKIDNSNNIVAASGSAWVQSSSLMTVSRRSGAAFGYNGYLYMVGGYDSGSGVLPNIEFVKINVSDGSLIGNASNSNKWNVSKVQISQTWGLSVPVSNSYAYVIGGCTTGASPSSCTVRTDAIQTFQLYNNDSGAPAGFSTSANTFSTAANRVGVSGAVLNGYLYAAGGCTSTGTNYCTTATNNVSYAALDTSGSVGSWSSTSANLPANRAWGKLRAAGGTLYYIGGQSDTASDFRTEVYYGTPSSGNVSTWSTASTGLPNARTNFGASVWNNRLYVVGGQGSGTGCSGGVCNTVYVSPQLNSGGNITSSWSTSSTSFNVARSGAVVIAYANNLYILGGSDGTNLLSDTQYSQISTSTGDAGSWSYSTSLPKAITQGDGFAANGYIYIMGGQTAVGACSPVTLVAPMSANTTIASGNNPTGIGAWYETNQRYTGSRFGNAAVYNDGKAYVYGGSCDVSGTVTYASPVTQQTTLLSQPQVAKYSIMIDTDSDVFPTHWLLNGTDNSIGARWQLKYRSMTNPGAGAGTNCSASAMSTWGQETNFGNVTLGLPGVYTAKDGSGTNTNCARYYYFNVTVDVSQAFGYPDDVSWGPTITDLTMHYSADPAKRLLHGRTFVGGLQQPIDTSYYTN